MWVARDPEDPGEGGRSYCNLTLASSFNSTMDASMRLDASARVEAANMSLGEVGTAYLITVDSQ